jgi:hypothetical protein
MNWYIDVFSKDGIDPDVQLMAEMRDEQDADRSLPCEDDYEETLALMMICPEESSHEEGSPLRFRNEDDGKLESILRFNESVIDSMLDAAMKKGWPENG